MTNSGITPKAARHGESWSDDEDERLAGLLTGPGTIEEVAGRLGRSPTAVRERARKMLPDHPDIPRGGAAVVDWLRERLREGLDWRATLDETLRPAQAYQPWREEEVEALIAALRSGSTPRDLARAHARTESAVLRRLSELLPPDIGHRRSDRARTEALRELLAANPEVPWRTAITPTVHVLVGWTGGTVAHVSLHPDESTAESTRAAVPGDVTWSLTTHPLPATG